MSVKSAAVDWATVARVLGGGAMLGAGAGAGVTFLNHLHELQQPTKPSDDDTLYLDLPARPPVKPGGKPGFKRASTNPNNASTFALSSLAGLVGSAVAYNTVRDVYNRRRKAELESQLQQAQHIHLNTNLDSAALSGVKRAGTYSLPTKVVGTGYLAFLLSALGSAVVANKMLNKRFPAVESPTEGQPKKIVVRTVDPKSEQPVEEGKAYPGSVSPDAMEGLVRTQMNGKMASHNEVVDVVCAAAAGHADDIKRLIKTAGISGMLDSVKGASKLPTDPVRRNLAVTWMCTDPLVKEAMAPIVAAEFFKCASWTYDVLPQLPSMGLDEDHLVGLVEASARGAREIALAPVFSKMASVTKSAEEGHMGISPLKTLFLAGAIKTFMDKQPDGNHADNDKMNQNLAANEESHPDGEAHHEQGVDLEVDDPAAQRFVDQNRPVIDKTLARQS